MNDNTIIWSLPDYHKSLDLVITKGGHVAFYMFWIEYNIYSGEYWFLNMTDMCDILKTIDKYGSIILTTDAGTFNGQKSKNILFLDFFNNKAICIFDCIADPKTLDYKKIISDDFDINESDNPQFTAFTKISFSFNTPSYENEWRKNNRVELKTALENVTDLMERVM